MCESMIPQLVMQSTLWFCHTNTETGPTSEVPEALDKLFDMVLYSHIEQTAKKTEQ